MEIVSAEGERWRCLGQDGWNRGVEGFSAGLGRLGLDTYVCMHLKRSVYVCVLRFFDFRLHVYVCRYIRVA